MTKDELIKDLYTKLALTVVKAEESIQRGKYKNDYGAIQYADGAAMVADTFLRYIITIADAENINLTSLH